MQHGLTVGVITIKGMKKNNNTAGLSALRRHVRSAYISLVHTVYISTPHFALKIKVLCGLFSGMIAD